MARGKDTVKVVVTPSTDNALKESFVKVNGKVIPFGVPMELTQDDINAIKRLKEPKRTGSQMTALELMEQLKIPQEKANKLLRENVDMRQKMNVRYVNKYFVSKA